MQIPKSLEPKGNQRYKSAIFKGYIALSTVIFGILAILAKQFPYFSIDLAISKTIQQYNSTWFDTLMVYVSLLGNRPQFIYLLVLVAGSLYIAKLKWEAIMGVVAATLATTVGIIMKDLIQRPRPDEELLRVFTNFFDYSFPSGHVLLYTVYFGFLLYLAFTLIKKSLVSKILLTTLAIPIILVGVSRIYLGAHWASDVFGAYLLGSLLLFFVIFLYRKVKK